MATGRRRSLLATSPWHGDLLSRCIRQISDASFGDAILEVGIDATITYSLTFTLDVVDKCIVGKASVIGMVVYYGHVVLSGIILKSILGVNRFVGGQAPLEVDVAQSRVIVHEDGGGSIPCTCEPSFQLRNEA